MTDTVVVGAQGRIVLPAATRTALGIETGQRLSVRVDGRLLILQRPEDAAAELRRLGEAITSGRSLLEELLAERQAEAAAE